MFSIIRSGLPRLLSTVAPVALASGVAAAAPKDHVGNAAGITVSAVDTAAGAKVSIAGFAFGPQAIMIKAGDDVTWRNDDRPVHTVTFRDGSAGARSLSPGQTFTRVFEEPGTYQYFCSIHPHMTGTVVVQPK
jgi:plastocyanin